MCKFLWLNRSTYLLTILGLSGGVQAAHAEPLLNVTGDEIVQQLAPGGAALLGTLLVSTLHAFQSGLVDANHTLQLIDELILTKKEINEFRRREVSQANIRRLDQLKSNQREFVRVLTALQQQSFERVGAAELRSRKDELKTKFKKAATTNRYIVVGGNVIALGLLSIGAYNILEADRVGSSLMKHQLQSVQFENLDVQFWENLRLYLDLVLSAERLFD